MVGAVAGDLAQFGGKSAGALKSALSDTFEQDDFKAASGPGANSKEKMETRIQLVRHSLLAA